MSTQEEDIGTSDTLIGSLLVSISEVIRSLESLQAETERFLECACYFYRVSVVLMEIQTAESNVVCSIDIFESLSDSIDVAKNLVEKSQESNGAESTTDLRSIEAGFEGVVKQMGETLQSIPESTFDEEEYIGVVIQSLSNEMQNASIGDGSKSEMIQNGQQKISEKHPPEIVSEQMEEDLYPTDPEFSYESYMMYSESQSQMTEIPDIPSQSTDVSRQRKHGNHSESQSQVTKIPDIPSQSTNVSSQREHGDLSKSQSQITEIPDIPSQSSNASSQRKYGILSESLSMLPQVTQFMEPPYQAFICPLTKEIMDDPVTTKTGITGQKLTTELSENVVLKTIIQEWKVRNEAARIKVAHAALSLGGSESMVIDALRDLQMTCEGKEYNKVRVREAGIIQLLDRYP